MCVCVFMSFNVCLCLIKCAVIESIMSDQLAQQYLISKFTYYCHYFFCSQSIYVWHLITKSSRKRQFTVYFMIPFFTQQDKNLYGSHPFYLVVEHGGLSHGVFLHNSNFMGKRLPNTSVGFLKKT